MVNYACAFSQSELGKYFEWIIKRKITVIEYKLSKKIPLHEKVMSEYISTNSGIHHQFRIYDKGGKVSQLWVSFCSAQSIQWVASGKKSAFLLLPLLS